MNPQEHIVAVVDSTHEEDSTLDLARQVVDRGGRATVVVLVNGTTTNVWTWHPTPGFTEHDRGELASVTALAALPDGYLATARDRQFRDRVQAETNGEDTIIWILPSE